MPAQIIQTLAFTQIMVIWTPCTTPEDHLKTTQSSKGVQTFQYCNTYTAQVRMFEERHK